MDVQSILNNFSQIEWERIKNIDFPYPNIKKEQCENEFLTLCSKQLSIKTPSLIIKRFHQSIYKASRENRPSSIEYWKQIQNDFSKFQKFYKNRLIHSNWAKNKSNEKYVNVGYLPNNVYVQGMTTSGKAPVPSYFKPMFAKYLINKYLKEYETIFDPFSGYSGRLLGALACGKNYVGHDANETTINESRYLVEFLRKYFEVKSNTFLQVKDSLKFKGSYDCLLTCTPYSDIEHWNDNDKKYSCDEWIDKCLRNFKCEKYVFVVDDKIKKYKKYVKEKITNTSHWGSNLEYIIAI